MKIRWLSLCIVLFTLLLMGCEPTISIIPEDQEIPVNIIDLSKESSIVGDLLSTGLTCLLIETENGEEPTCDYVSHPEGAMGKSITNAKKVPGRLRIVQGNTILYDSGEYISDSLGMTLRIRGNTTAYTDKKPYKIQLQKKEDLLFRGDKKYMDKSWVLIKDSESMTTNNEMFLKPFIGMKVCELIGLDYVPQGKYVNVVMNGDYRGIYYLSENVKRNTDCRVNISKKGGYLVEYDPYWWNELYFFDTGITSTSFRYTFKYPDEGDITSSGISYIQDIMIEMESHLDDISISSYIDLESFAKWILAHDLLGSNDTGGINKYLSKYDNTSDSKIKMGPLWDFDGIMNIRDAFPGIHVLEGYNLYYDHLFNNSEFLELYLTIWDNLSDSFCNDLNSIFDDYLDSDEARSLNKARVFENQKWGEDYKSVSDNIIYAESYFADRVSWLKTNIPLLKE